MVRFSCFQSTSSNNRSKKVALQLDETMLVISQMTSQDRAAESSTGSTNSNPKKDENNSSAVTMQYNASSHSHEECCRSEDLNRCPFPDYEKEVTHLKKCRSLGNMLEKERDFNCKDDECDAGNNGVDCHYSSFKNSKAVEESAKLCDKNNENAFDGSSDPLYREPLSLDERRSGSVGELSSENVIDSKGSSSCQPRFSRSHSAEFQTNADSDLQGATNSDILGPHCRSFEDLCSIGGAKVEYLSGDEAVHSKLNLDMHLAEPSCHDMSEASYLEEKVSEARSDAAQEGQRSSTSGGCVEVQEQMLNDRYWNGKSVCSNQSVDPLSPCADLVDNCHHSNSGALHEFINPEEDEQLWYGNSGYHQQELDVDVCYSKDFSLETRWGESETNGLELGPKLQDECLHQDYTELTPRAFSIKRIEDWINKIDMENAMVVEEQGESSYSPSVKGSEQVIGAPAARPDAKSPLGMEIAYKYISKLSPTSSSAQLANHGLVAIPILSAFTGLRLLNLSGNSIVRITAGALPKGLHMLNLSRNSISIIEGLRELTRLRVLDISYNRISRIGHGLASCSSLKELYLVGNKISEVEGLHRLLKLKILDLRINKISTSKGLGQLAANYNSLEAINLDGNPAQKNVGDEHLKKYLLSLLPHLAYYNKQSIRATGSKEISDRHARIASSHRADRGVRSERKSSRLVSGAAGHKSQSSRHARSGRASSSLLKPSRSRNMPLPLLGSGPSEHSIAGQKLLSLETGNDPVRRTESDGKMQ